VGRGQPMWAVGTTRISHGLHGWRTADGGKARLRVLADTSGESVMAQVSADNSTRPRLTIVYCLSMSAPFLSSLPLRLDYPGPPAE
jgi:hypothetical protein